jgi:HlyD family secretion protein/adhesin transport system membrane fusion protein
MVRFLLLLAGGALAALIGWASIAPLSQRVAAVGAVVPTGSVLGVQHLEGGIVAAIEAREGAVVQKGTVLVRLDPIATRAEHERTRTRMAAFALRAERLRAFAEGRTPDFRAIDVPADAAPLIADQEQIWRNQVSKRDSERELLDRAIRQREEELNVLAGEAEMLQEEKKILEELVAMREELAGKGLISKVVYLGTLQKLVNSRGALRKNHGETARARQALAEATEKRAHLDTELRSAALAEMGEITAELAQLARQVEKTRDQLNRLEIRSPVRGVVKSLVPNTIGGVIAPGTLVAEIVPIESDLLAEVRIAPQDIGQLERGQAVSLRISAYDFYRYGGVSGTLEHISASTFQDDKGVPYYKGRIRLAAAHVGADAAANTILPGMTVDADIQTGQRTVLQYLLKPVFLSIGDAFKES